MLTDSQTYSDTDRQKDKDTLHKQTYSFTIYLTLLVSDQRAQWVDRQTEKADVWGSNSVVGPTQSECRDTFHLTSPIVALNGTILFEVVRKKGRIIPYNDQ